MLQLIYNLIFNNLGTVLIGLTTYLIISWILEYKRLPPGPFPLPILGNLLTFIRAESSSSAFKAIREKYGDVFTVRFGSLPFVIVTDYELSKEALLSKKIDFAGRPRLIITDMVMEYGGPDIAFVDYSEGWDTLKKLGHTAIRKYVANDRMPERVVQTTDEIVNMMLKEGKSYDPVDHLYLLILSLSAMSAFGQKYTMDSEDFVKLRAINKENKKIASNGFPVDFIPLLRPFYLRTEFSLRKCMKELFAIIRKGFQNRLDTYQSGTIRDFSDALLASREEAVKEDSSLLKYMTDNGLMMVVNDLFSAGVDTTCGTLEWAIRYMVKNPEMQEKMYQEIQDKIGSERMALQEDRLQLHYIWAFLTELFRLRPAAPFGLPHRTMADTELGGHKIPKNTAVMFDIGVINRNPKYWSNPDDFKPERFLDADGNFTKERLLGYIPFGLGRRNCVGEKLAKANLFLIIVRLLQRCKFESDGEVDMRPLDKVITSEVRPCKIFVKPRV